MTDSYIGEGMTAVTPYLYIQGAAEAIAFYEAVLGAEVRLRMPGPDGKVAHAELVIDGAVVMLGEENPEMDMPSPKRTNGMASGLLVYVRDVDATLAAAVEAGATLKRPAEDMFWGDRMGHLIDPFGHSWSIATHVEDVAPDEMARRQQEWMQSCGGQ